MTDATKPEAKPDALAAQGASPKDIDDSQSLAGAPKAPPEPSNEPPKPAPKKEGMDETFDAPKKEETAKDPPKEEPAKGPLKQYITLDDPAGQGAIEVMKEAGVDPNDAEKFFSKAMETGDLSLVDWQGIEDKIGKAKLFLVKSGVEAYHSNLQKQVDATVAQTHSIFGTKDNFETVKTWAQGKEKADPAFAKQIDDIRDLLNAGGTKAASGARELLRLYNTDANTKGLHTSKLVTGDSTGTVIGTPLTRAEYVAELHKAHDRGAKPHEIAALGERRKAGLAANI